MDSLFEGRFVHLQRYFKGLTLDDLPALSPEDLVDAADSQDKLLMRVFAKHLGSRLGQLDPFVPPTMPFAQPKKKETTRKTLELANGQVLSHAFKSLRVVGKTPMDEVATKFEQQMKEVEIVDLSANNLLDDDLPIVVALVERCPRIQEIDLSNNRFHGYSKDTQPIVDKAIQALLSRSPPTSVNISGNPLATIDRKDLFASFSSTELSRLIWIPEPWLKGSGWNNMIPKEELQEIVRRTHEVLFYLSGCLKLSNIKYLSCLAAMPWWATFYNAIPTTSLKASIQHCQLSLTVTLNQRGRRVHVCVSHVRCLVPQAGKAGNRPVFFFIGWSTCILAESV
jgi:hypothetical protein